MRGGFVLLVAACGRVGFSFLHEEPPGDAPSSAGCGFEQLALGAGTTCALRAGEAFCWGDNREGQLGDGTMVDRSSPALVQTATVFASIARGEDKTACAIATDRTAWCWGSGADLMLGGLARSLVPVVITADGVSPFADVAELMVGEWHGCARRTDGSAWCWGGNGFDQLGRTGNDAANPVVVMDGALPLVADQLAVGFATSCVRTGERAQCWGWNMWGQLGNGTAVSRAAPAPVLSSSAPLDQIVDLALGYLHGCALLADRTARCWGTGSQLGNPSNGGATSRTAIPVFTVQGPLLDDIAELAAGDDHSCARRRDGTVWCWGGGVTGQLGDGTTDVRSAAAPVLVGGAPLTGALALALGNAHSCVLREHDVLCWGAGARGELGSGTAVAFVTEPVAVLCP